MSEQLSYPPKDGTVIIPPPSVNSVSYVATLVGTYNDNRNLFLTLGTQLGEEEMIV
jgi:hypothetical protein